MQRSALSTFNVLNLEGRRVAAALLPNDPEVMRSKGLAKGYELSLEELREREQKEEEEEREREAEEAKEREQRATPPKPIY